MAPGNPSSNAAIVQDFLDALEDRQLDRALALLDREVEWLNTGLPTLRGARVRGALRQMDRRGIGFRVDHHAIAEDGEVVLTDRTDYLRVGPVENAFWVRGTFVVRDGLIVRWDDAFGWGAFLGSGVAAVARALVGRGARRGARD